jgi:hypothetical protein
VITSPVTDIGTVIGVLYQQAVPVFADVGPGTGGVEATARAERDLAAQVRAGGARLLGPNCLGFVDTAADVSLAWGDFPAGDVGLVSQSGQVGIEVGHLLGRAGLGLSRFVSVGAAVDVTAPEVIASYVDDPRTRVVAVYLESLGDADALVAAGHALVGVVSQPDRRRGRGPHGREPGAVARGLHDHPRLALPAPRAPPHPYPGRRPRRRGRPRPRPRPRRGRGQSCGLGA